MTIGNFGFLILGLLGGILALVGLLDVVRGTPVREVEAFGGGTLPGVDEPAFRVAMELLSGAQLVDGNSVEIFWNGDQTYPRLWSDLRGARRSITLQLYYNKPGRMADMLSDILVERAQAGVRVLFLYDAFGTSFKKEYLRKLRDGGVRTQSFRPITVMALNKIQHRAHIRVVCIDGEIGWTGGFGIDDKWFGNGRTKDQWRDSNARFTGPAVDQLQAASRHAGRSRPASCSCFLRRPIAGPTSRSSRACSTRRRRSEARRPSASSLSPSAARAGSCTSRTRTSSPMRTSGA
jgi:cardiolipin synthase A/B